MNQCNPQQTVEKIVPNNKPMNLKAQVKYAEIKVFFKKDLQTYHNERTKQILSLSILRGRRHITSIFTIVPEGPYLLNEIRKIKIFDNELKNLLLTCKRNIWKSSEIKDLDEAYQKL